MSELFKLCLVFKSEANPISYGQYVEFYRESAKLEPLAPARGTHFPTMQQRLTHQTRSVRGPSSCGPGRGGG